MKVQRGYCEQYQNRKVLSWSVAGLSEDSTDSFSAAFDAHIVGYLVAAGVFQKMDGVTVGAQDLFTASELVGGLRCPAVIIHPRWNGQAIAVGGASRWTVVELGGQLTVISAHLPHKGRKLGEFEDVMRERSGQHLTLDGDFNANFFGLTDFHFWESQF